MDSFSSLIVVGGYFRIRDNAALTDVDGLSSLTTVAVDLKKKHIGDDRARAISHAVWRAGS